MKLNYIWTSCIFNFRVFLVSEKPKKRTNVSFCKYENIDWVQIMFWVKSPIRNPFHVTSGDLRKSSPTKCKSSHQTAEDRTQHRTVRRTSTSEPELLSPPHWSEHSWNLMIVSQIDFWDVSRQHNIKWWVESFLVLFLCPTHSSNISFIYMFLSCWPSWSEQNLLSAV